MGITALIVDDDPEFLALAGRVCEEIGLEVAATASDGASAIAAAKEAKPQAVLVDIGLPDRDGIELGAELAALPWRPRVVLTSTDEGSYGPTESSESGVEMPFIAKDELAGERLRRLLAGD